jgi:4-amino-4-deoxy-L-arabinose transferase-like glycosyltransferase
VKRRLTIILLALILICAAALRLYGLRWDGEMRGYPHPDERHLANTMSRLTWPGPGEWAAVLNDPDHSPLNPRKQIPGSEEHYDLAYGTLPVYLYRGTAVALAAIARDPDLDSYDVYRFVGRGVTALLSVLTVLWVYQIGRRTYGTPAALLGAALLAVCVLHIQLSHFMTVDLFMSALLTAGLLLAVRFAQRGRTWDALWMGLLGGLTMAAKFNGVTLLAGIAAAYGVAWLARKRTLKDLLAFCLPLTLAGWFAAFALFEYYAIRDPYTYATAIGTQAKMVNGATDWPYTRQYINTTPYLFQLKNLVAWGMGWPLGIAAVAAVLVAVLTLVLKLAPRKGQAQSLLTSETCHPECSAAESKGLLVARLGSTLQNWAEHPRRAGTLVLLGWALPFFLYTARLEVKFLRYMLPLTPVLCLLCADLLWRLGGLLRFPPPSGGGPRALQAARWALIALVLVPSALWSLAYMRVYAQDHPWLAGSRWFYENAPQGSFYTWEAWGDPLPINLPQQDLYRERRGYRDVWMHIYHDMPVQDKLQHIQDSLRQADYVVLSTPRLYLSVARSPWRYPVEIRYYQLLFEERLGYELAARFTAFPGLGPLEINDLSADQSFFDYEHPLVLVYRKTRDLSDQEWQALFAEQLKVEPRASRVGDQAPVQLPIPGGTSFQLP